MVVFYGGDGVFGQWFGVDVLLVGQLGFDDGVGVVVFWYFQCVVVDFFEQVYGFEFGDDGFVCGEVVYVGVVLWQVGVEVWVDVVVEVEYLGLGQYCGVFVEDVDQWQVVVFVYFVVVEVVGWGDFYVVGVEFVVDVFVGDDWDVLVDDWQFGELVDQFGVVFVFWVYCDCGVVQQGFWMGSGDYQVVQVFVGFCVVYQWVVQVLEVVFFVVVFYFQVGNCGVQFGVLVYQVFVVVDQVVFMQVYEGFFDCFGEVVVYGEVFV